MNTPIYDFVSKYAESESVRFHMPGHKGENFLGCEVRDITEIKGADELYDAEGIIAESEWNAAELFGTGRTVFSTEGSSQCIRAMLYLATMARKPGERPVVVAARNVHKAFVYAAVLLDIEVVWLWPERTESLCSCSVSAETLQKTLQKLSGKVAAVYLTSPDYLGGEAEIAALASVCHKHGTVLAVDNAHGAYLHFLHPSKHPMDLGADICCDSAHKTLPVLTGGAYLHISKNAPKEFAENAKQAMELFGSTSPSYLILQSLDLCNRYLAEGYGEKLEKTIKRTEKVRERIRNVGWQIPDSDPLRITIKTPEGICGKELADCLRVRQIECEYADRDFLVLMTTPENEEKDFERLVDTLGETEAPGALECFTDFPEMERVLSLREAYFMPGEVVPVEEAVGRICRRPMATCPPAIPIVVPGEKISREAVDLFLKYGMDNVDVVR